MKTHYCELVWPVRNNIHRKITSFFLSKPRSYGKTGGTKFSTIKKAAAVGAVAYGAYKIGKLSTKFSSLNWGTTYHPKYSFDSWNRWRQDDGLLCRNDYDCWISSDMVCYPETFSLKINSGWFGGNGTPIGRCGCKKWAIYTWDDDNLGCNFRGWVTSLIVLTAIVGLIMILIVFWACCCNIRCQ